MYLNNLFLNDVIDPKQMKQKITTGCGCCRGVTYGTSHKGSDKTYIYHLFISCLQISNF